MALNINGTTGISGVDGSASAPALQGTDSNTGINFGSDTVNINTGGIARATVDSNGRLGVGLTSPTSFLHLHESSSGSIEGLKVTNSATGTTITDGLSIGLQSDEDVFIHNYENTAMHFGTNDTTRLSILAGGGLTFNGDTAAANALNDYEEGTFTPTVSQGFTSVQYETNGRQGSYTKIGRFVFFTLMIHLGGSTATASSGIEITGLPFTAKSFSHDNAAAGGADPFYQDGFYNANDFSAIVVDGQTKLQLVRRNDGAALTGTSTNGGREFRMTGTYMT